MRILLDECLPARLGRDLVGHEVSTAPKMGALLLAAASPVFVPGSRWAKPRQWAGLKNGALLTRAVAAGFDIFLTVDKNLPKQQKLAAHAIAVVVLRCATNDIADLKKLVPELLIKLPSAKKGEALLVG